MRMLLLLVLITGVLNLAGCAGNHITNEMPTVKGVLNEAPTLHGILSEAPQL